MAFWPWDEWQGLGWMLIKQPSKISTDPKEMWSWAPTMTPESRAGALKEELGPPPTWHWCSQPGRSWGKPCNLKQFHRQRHFWNRLQGCESHGFRLFSTAAFGGAIGKAQTGSASQSCLASHLQLGRPVAKGGNHWPVTNCLPTPLGGKLLTEKSNLPVEPLVTKSNSEQDAGGEF